MFKLLGFDDISGYDNNQGDEWRLRLKPEVSIYLCSALSINLRKMYLTIFSGSNSNTINYY